MKDEDNDGLRGIFVDNTYDWFAEKGLDPPLGRVLKVSDFVQLDSFKLIYISKTAHYFNKWAKRRYTDKLPDGGLEIHGSVIKGNRNLLLDIDVLALSGGLDVWCCLEKSIKPLCAILQSGGGKVFLNDNKALNSELINDLVQAEIFEWGVEGSLYVGFSHDLDDIYIIGSPNDIVALYKMLPNEEIEDYKIEPFRKLRPDRNH